MVRRCARSQLLALVLGGRLLGTKPLVVDSHRIQHPVLVEGDGTLVLKEARSIVHWARLRIVIESVSSESETDKSLETETDRETERERQRETATGSRDRQARQ